MKTLNDVARLNALRATNLMDTPAAPAFDRLTRLASKLLGSPGVMVSLVDDRRLFFKSAVGLPEPLATRREMPLAHSLCLQVVQSGGPVIVTDARLDDRSRNHPAFHELNIVSYLGVPLRTQAGHTLGSFCVTDKQPRTWTPGEVGLVSEIAQSVITEIELHTRLSEPENSLFRFQYWFDHLPQGCLMCGPDGRIKGWNPAAARTFGFSAGQAIGATPHELLFAPEHQPAAQEYFGSTADGPSAREFERPARTAAGKTIICDWALAALRRLDGGFDGFIVMVKDVTQQAQAREQLEQLEAQLRHSQKLTAIGHLVSSVAHDLNNLITVILAHSDFLKTSAALTREMAESVAVIHGTAQRGSSLTRQLLMFTRKHATRSENVDLNGAIRNISKLLVRLLGENIRMKLQLAAEPLFIQADANLLDQVIMNLVINARDAMAQGGELVIEARPVEFNRPAQASERTGPFACLTVRDSGCGIAPEVLPRIFDPFFTTKEASHGTGLGLSTVQGIIKQHHGWIEIESQPGHGTTARVFFPQRASQPDPHPTAEIAPH